MKICTEQDCLQAHITLIGKAPRRRNPILRKVNQKLASMLVTLRFRREKSSAQSIRAIN